MKRVLLVLLAVAAVAGALVAWRWRAGGDAVGRYETAAVDRGRVVARVTATGTLSALVTVQVGSQVSGRISELHADFNDRVRKGQLIARIDPALFEAAVQQQRANVVAAQGNLARARAQAADAGRQLARTQDLFQKQLASRAELDTARATAEAADASVQASQGSLAQARAAAHQAEVNLAYTRIVSPTDGVVISRNVDVGQTVAASLQAPTLFVIAEDLARMQVDTSVAEADVGRLRAGMPASFTVDAWPGETFQGAVRQVRNAPQTVQNVVTYDAVVDVANPEQRLKPGMTATVTFIYAEREDALRLPNAALRFRPPASLRAARGAAAPAAQPAAERQGAGGAGQGGARGARPGGRGAAERTVWVVRAPGRAPEPVQIRTGISDGSVTEVLEGGLQAGDAVVTEAVGGAGGGAQGGGAPGMGGGRGRGPF
ncbi:MAG: efflux RND transporter periplasmic adaptor subunit [Anaeromyxobacter sp.]